MTALQSDRDTQSLLEEANYIRVGKCAAGTYYRGQLIVKGLSDGLYKPCSGSIDSVGAGVSQENKVVATSGVDYLTIDTGGAYYFSGSGFSATTKPGSLIYATDDQTITPTAGTNTLVGRLFAHDVTLGVAVRMDESLITSGSTF